MSKRASERAPSSLVIKFSRDDVPCYGIVTDISEHGMCIRSGNCLTCDTNIKLQIPVVDGHLEIPVTVRRVEQTRDFYDTMGVELSRPTKQYLQLVSSIKDALETV